MKKKTVTKKDYENYLNELSPDQESEQWIIGGTLRMYHRALNQYGTAVRKYDSIMFEVGFNEWQREQDRKN